MSFYICSNCGYGSASWMGRCPDCGAWNSFKQQSESNNGKKNQPLQEFELTSLAKIKISQKQRLATGIFEFDRVVGGGFFPGSVTLLTGEPGIGKSTLVLQILKNFKTLYISGEEGAEQVKERLDRLKILGNNFDFSNTQQIEAIIKGLDKNHQRYEIIIIDSIQTVYSNKVEGSAGSISQLREVASQLIAFAKTFKIPIILIGHITKEGEVAGPKTLEHMVDTVISFEGEKVSHFRILRSTKNRFGSTEEIGIFEMLPQGLSEVKNPLAFIDEEKSAAPGMAIVGVTEGKRPIFFEIQTLLAPTILPIPRRVVKGIDYSKILLLLAVLRKYYGFSLDKLDIYINVVGGVSIKSTAGELGIIASLISSFKNKALKKNLVFIGEIGLLGEIRKVVFEEKIIAEAQRLGFKSIFSSQNLKNIKDLKRLFTT
jgi:DNA repair protein RadA/Sms